MCGSARVQRRERDDEQRAGQRDEEVQQDAPAYLGRPSSCSAAHIVLRHV
jgi:hypothetical protein